MFYLFGFEQRKGGVRDHQKKSERGDTMGWTRRKTNLGDVPSV